MQFSKRYKYCLALLILVLLVFIVDFNQLIQALSNITYEIIIYLILLSFLLIYISALKWQYFVEALGTRISAVRLFAFYLIGYFVNLLVPSYIGGDVVRSWYVGKKIGQHQALAATILERYTGFVAMLALASVFVFYADGVTIQIKLAVLGLVLALVIITLIALNRPLLSYLSRFKLISKVVPNLQKIQQALLLAKKDRWLIVRSLILSFLFHSFTVVNAMAAAYAVGWYDVMAKDLFVVLPLILLIGAIPIAPAGLGIQEGAYLFFLKGIGATPAQALGIGVVLRAKAYLLALLGGIVWLFIREKKHLS